MAPLIHCTDLTKVYRKGAVAVHALSGVSFTIEAGEMVAIMGPSGAGKSTLMHILGCLDSPTSGRFSLNGEEVAHKSDAELATIRNAKIGFTFQSFHLLPRTTALENVLLPLAYSNPYPADAEARAAAALEAVGLGERASHTPAELSGGEQQRVAIARALVTNPQILLADEPTGNLDSVAGNEVLAIFQRLNAEGRTCIIVTHDAETARWTRRLIRLKDGRIVSDEPVPENERLYAKVPAEDLEAPCTPAPS
ncbi:MAG: ABC transporter ATP-binding protein [bacterium]